MSESNQNDLAELKREIDVNGYCIVRNVIDQKTIADVHRRIASQAKAEKELGVTAMDQVQTEDDKNQWVYVLINKGEIFQR